MRVRARRRAVVAALLGSLVSLVGCSGETATAPPAAGGRESVATSSASPAPGTASPTGAGPTASGSPAGPGQTELPRGGRRVFPHYRLVGYAGLTGAGTLGRLGTGPLDQRVREMEQRAAPYAAGREILPVLEVITTIVQGSPGRDGRYRTRISDDRIQTYLTAARKRHALLLLNLQPGRADFLSEAKAYRRWLAEPDVGLALDPEWAMGPNQVPGRVFGHTTGAELNAVAAYLAGIVEAEDLPEKVLIYHQLAPRIVRQERDLKPHRGVAVVKSVDGIGVAADKIHTYRVVNRTTPAHVHPGFKLFYTEDAKAGRLMTPQQVLALKPQPEYVLYE
ncbi:MAG: hypothetical protein ACJ72G_11870 [Friedmanniella sp.]